MLVAAPLAVEYNYTVCNPGNQSTVTVPFNNETSGGIAPYSYLWNFGDGTTSTQENPTHAFAYPGGPYTVTLTVTDSNLPTNLVGSQTQIVTIPGPCTISGIATAVSCANQNNGSIDVSVSGGTPPYSYSWNGGQTTQDISGLSSGTYSVTVTDAFGCTKTRSFTIGNGDALNPVITAPNDLSIEGCGPSSIGSQGRLDFSGTPLTITLAQFTAAGGTYTDQSPIATISYQDVVSGSCPTIVTRTFRLTDSCGNVGSDTQIFTINDTTAPVIATLPTPSTINCPAVPQFAQASVTDNCGPGFTLTHSDATTQGQCAGSYSVTRTWIATDACGNSSTKSQTINVQDVTAPVIAALPATSTINCPAVPQFATATANDACGSAFTLTFNDVTTPGQCAGSYSVTRTWTATDACGRSSTRSQTINVRDVTAPVVPQAPANVTVSCSGDIPPMISLTANDACSGPITVTGIDSVSAGSCSSNFTVTRTWTFVDACGNTSSVNQTINVRDTSNPVLPTPPANITVSCGAEVPPMISLTASDTCAGQITATGVDTTAPGNCPNSYVITRRWTFADPCGNSSSISQTITVRDITAPVVPQAPANVTVSCSGDIPPMISLTANDACSGPITVAGTDAVTAGSCSSSFTVTRTWTFVDACGNTSSVNQTINVRDTSNPVLPTPPANITVSCAGEVPPMISLTASDTCAGQITVTGVDMTAPGSCPSSYIITRRWTFVDPCGNSASISQTITVQDITAPVIAALPAPTTINCSAVPQFAQATATDNCGSAFTLTFSDVTTPGQCAGSYSVIRTWTAADACGNSSTASQTINVQDVAPPAVPQAPADVTVSCSGDIPPMISLTANDACTGPITMVGTDAITAGSCTSSFTVTRTWTFVDACGNTSSVNQTINVRDSSNPVLPTAPASITVSCAGEVPPMISLTASDTCAGQISVEGVDTTAPGSCPNSYIITRTWTFADPCGNSASLSQTITVSDQTPPALPEVPADLTVSCLSEVPAPLSLTAVDNCTGNITVNSVDTTVPGGCPNSFVVTRTWTFTDVCQNTSTMSQIITVFDETPPALVTNLSEVVTAPCSSIPAAPELEFSDSCGGEVTVVFEEHVDPNSEIEGSYDIIRTWTVTDICGNQTVVSQTVHVTVGDTFSADNPDLCNNDSAYATFNLMSLLPLGTESGGQWVGVNILDALINHANNTIDVTQLQTGYYTLQYILTTAQSPCPRKLEFYVHVVDDCGVLAACTITVNNGFSPNNDGENDYLIIDGLECYPENNLQIYNRWGILVFEKSGYNNTTAVFDGKSEGRATLNKGELLPGGTYFYIMKYKDNESGQWNDKSGYLYLSR
ncbi:hypothetical protein FEDK69T_05230 [Flavobacterium enshiense DK69]|nr:hypothetical protein FEDK69T_05230 [Flavobacterium enshiense DK69]